MSDPNIITDITKEELNDLIEKLQCKIKCTNNSINALLEQRKEEEALLRLYLQLEDKLC